MSHRPAYLLDGDVWFMIFPNFIIKHQIIIQISLYTKKEAAIAASFLRSVTPLLNKYVRIAYME